MCGRFAFFSPHESVVDLFAIEGVADVEPRFNIAPTQAVPAVRSAAGSRRLSMLHWGLVPFWAKDPAIGNRMINARAESLGEKPSFRNAYKRRRCLVLASGFYEWRKEGQAKTPYYITREDQRPFAMAGLWESWKGGDADGSLESCTIVTTRPNALMEKLHNRMPVILDGVGTERWLDAALTEPADLESLLRPAPVQGWMAYPVSRRVNNPRNEGPELIQPAGDALTA